MVDGIVGRILVALTALARHLELHGVQAGVTIEACQATGAATDRLAETFLARGAQAERREWAA